MGKWNYVVLEPLEGYVPYAYSCPHSGQRLMRRKFSIPEPARKNANTCEGFIMPGASAVWDRFYFTINKDYSVDYDPMKTLKSKSKPERSPFSIAPHRKENSCPFYEGFASGTKMDNDYQSAWKKPMFEGDAVVIRTGTDRDAHIQRIGGDELLRQYRAPTDSSREDGYCLFCFRANYLNFHLKQLDKASAAAAEASVTSKSDKAAAASYIQFRMPFTKWTDTVTAVGDIMKQESYPVKRYAYLKAGTEVKGVYQTTTNNMIKKQHVNRYRKGDFLQNRCLNMDDVSAIIGTVGVVQDGDWDAE